MNPTTVELLRQVPVFAALEDRWLQVLAARTRRRQFRANEALFFEGDPGHSLYVVIAGRVRIETTTADGRPVHLAERGPGEVVGEMALIDGKPRMADARTAETSDLLILDRAEFVRCVEESPRLALGVMACLADRLRQAADQRETLQADVLGRVSAALLDLLQAHGADGPGGSRRIGVRFSQPELALQAGTTRESANRALSRLKQVQAIRVDDDGHWLVLDEPRLRHYCGR
jgi:CRP-like cAMP-binding protein